jgi:hypothetical protein
MLDLHKGIDKLSAEKVNLSTSLNEREKEIQKLHDPNNIKDLKNLL